jgi:D-alanyl-D-alanine carboxypeptidase
MLRDGCFIVNPQFEWAGGGYAATPAQLARWARLLFEGKAYDPALLAQVLNGVEAPALGPGVRYGLGAIIRDTGPLGRSYGHSGFFPGYLTDVRYYPDHGFAVAVQMNTSTRGALAEPLGTVTTRIAAMVAERLAR